MAKKLRQNRVPNFFNNSRKSVRAQDLIPLTFLRPSCFTAILYATSTQLLHLLQCQTMRLMINLRSSWPGRLLPLLCACYRTRFHHCSVPACMHRKLFTMNCERSWNSLNRRIAFDQHIINADYSIIIQSRRANTLSFIVYVT